MTLREKKDYLTIRGRRVTGNHHHVTTQNNTGTSFTYDDDVVDNFVQRLDLGLSLLDVLCENLFVFGVLLLQLVELFLLPGELLTQSGRLERHRDIVTP